MTLSPKEATNLTPKDLEKIEEIERMINKAIRSSTSSKFVSVRIPDQLPGRIYDELARRYREAGWREVWVDATPFTVIHLDGR